MDATLAGIDAPIVAGGLALCMVASWGVGWLIGRKMPNDPDDKSSSRFVDGSLGLLALLLGFTFAMALGKHEQRRVMIITDANGISDYYTVASMLPEPQRKNLQDQIRNYMDIRLNVARNALDQTAVNKAMTDSEEIQQRMSVITAEVAQTGTPLMIPLVNTLNGVASNHISLIAAMHDRLPTPVLMLLTLTAIMSTILVGRHHGKRDKLHLSGTLCYVLLVSLVVWVIMDLNQPTRGAIRVSIEPLERVAAGMK